MRFRANKSGFSPLYPTSFSTDRSIAVPPLQFFFVCASVVLYVITKTRLFKSIEIFTTKNWKCSDRNSDIFHISAQNIDCGYSLEPPRRGGSNEYQQYVSEQK